MNPERHWHEPDAKSYSLTPQVTIGTQAFLMLLYLVLFGQTIQSFAVIVPLADKQLDLEIHGVEHVPRQFKLSD